MASTNSGDSLPGPGSLPLLGLRRAKLRFYQDPIAYHCRLHRSYGALARFAHGSTKIAAYGPEYNRQLLSQPDLFHTVQIAPPGPSSVLRWLSAGLPNQNGAEHKRQRRLIMPAFHRQHVAAHVADMALLTQQRLDRWPLGRVADISLLSRDLALGISSTLLFGWSAGAEDHALARLIDRWLTLVSSAAAHLVPIPCPGTPYARLLAHSRRLYDRLLALVRQRRAHPAEGVDVLTMLLGARDEDGTQLTDDEVIGQLNVLFLAGFESTAMALTWTLFLLSQHPRVAAALLDELAGALRGGAPTTGQLGALPLLDGVVKESLRLLPPASHGARVGVAPFAMGGYEFPAGTKVLFSSYVTHRMPEIFPQPARFLPQRWAGIAPTPYEYLPFGAGPRMCIGATFAMTEIKVALALLLQRYRLTMAPGALVDRGVRFTLTPRHGMPMRIDGQDRRFVKVPVRGNIHEMVDITDREDR